MAHIQTLTLAREQPSLLQRVRGAVTAVRSYWRSPISSSSHDGWNEFWGTTPSATGVTVSSETALTYAPFFSGVQLISRDVASLPLFHYKRLKPFGKQKYTDSWIYGLLHDEFNPEMSSMTAREIMQAHVLTWGNAYAEIERDSANRPVALWPLTPDRVAPYRDARGALRYRVTGIDGPSVTLPAADVLHIHGLGYDGLVGYSLIAKARDSIGLGIATERFGATFFGNGATFGGVISYPGARPTELSEKSYREQLEGKHQGVARAHKLLALYNGASYTRIGIPPDDAQFLETRKFQIEEQARWLNLPPHKIGALDRATFSNIEQQSIDYVISCLRGWLVRWEQELNRKLISPLEQQQQFCEHVMDALLRGDTESRYRAYAIGRQWGWLCADDIRDWENLSPLPNGQGQVFLVPANMWPADKIPDPTAKPEAAPPTNTETTPTKPTREQIDALQRQLTDATATLRQQLDALADAEAARTQAAVSAAEIKAFDTLTRAQTSEIETLRAQIVEQQRTVSSLTQALDDAQAAIKAADERAASEAVQCAAAEAIAEKALADSTLLSTRVRELDTAKAEAEQVAARHDEARKLATDAATAAQSAEREAEVQVVRLVVGMQQVTAAKSEADAMIETLRAQLAEAQQATAASIAARRVAEAEFETARAQVITRDDQLRAVKVAHRGLLVETFQRLLQREIDRARKHQMSREKFRHWLDSFYQVHADVCRDALRPVVAAWLDSANREHSETQLSAFVTTYVQASERELRDVADARTDQDFITELNGVLQHWERHRASDTADRILREGLHHG